MVPVFTGATPTPAQPTSRRCGRGRVFVGGHVLLLAAYASMVPSELGTLHLVPLLASLGAYFAATDGVLAALGSAALPKDVRTSGLALLNTFAIVSRVLGAVVFGALWAVVGLTGALVLFVGWLVVAIPGAALLLRAGTRTGTPAVAA